MLRSRTPRRLRAACALPVHRIDGQPAQQLHRLLHAQLDARAGRTVHGQSRRRALHHDAGEPLGLTTGAAPPHQRVRLEPEGARNAPCSALPTHARLSRTPPPRNELLRERASGYRGRFEASNAAIGLGLRFHPRAHRRSAIRIRRDGQRRALTPDLRRGGSRNGSRPRRRVRA